jgi:hypothetical protein
VSQLCVNTLPATKITLITDGIQFGSLRVKASRPREACDRSLSVVPLDANTERMTSFHV